MKTLDSLAILAIRPAVSSFTLCALLCIQVASAADMEYLLTRLDSGAVEVQLNFTASNTTTTTLKLESEWGGIKNDGSDVGDLDVSSQAGAACKVSRESDTSWRVEHEPAARLMARYVIKPQSGRTPHRGNDYRTVVRPDLFHTIFHLSLLHPDPSTSSEAQLASIRLAFAGFEKDDARIMSSFGQGEERTVRLSRQHG